MLQRRNSCNGNARDLLKSSKSAVSGKPARLTYKESRKLKKSIGKHGKTSSQDDVRMEKFGLESEAPTDDDASSVQLSLIMPRSLGNLILSGRNKPAEGKSALPQHGVAQPS